MKHTGIYRNDFGEWKIPEHIADMIEKAPKRKRIVTSSAAPGVELPYAVIEPDCPEFDAWARQLDAKHHADWIEKGRKRK